MRLQKRCPICNSIAISIRYIVRSFIIAECKQCTFVFVQNSPSQKQLDVFYSKKDIQAPELTESVIRDDAQRSLSILENYCSTKRLFDVGCGRGYFLDEARNNHWEISGIDFSSEVISYAKNTYHLPVKQANIFTYKSTNPYPIVSLNQVIEHFSDPIKLICACKNLLEQNGLIYIATPNIESLSAKIFGEYFDYMIPPEHLSFFGPKTLKKSLEKNGFKILFIDTWSYRAEFAGIIKHFFKKQRNISSTHKKILQPSLKKKNIQETPLKTMKKIIFDDIFCNLFHPVLDVNKQGSMVHVIAQKITE